MSQTTTTEQATYTEAQAADEALRMLYRRARRHMSDKAFKEMIASLSDGIRDTIHLAENRADKLMWADKEAGITRKMLTISDIVEAQMAAEGDED